MFSLIKTFWEAVRSFLKHSPNPICQRDGHIPEQDPIGGVWCNRCGALLKQDTDGNWVEDRPNRSQTYLALLAIALCLAAIVLFAGLSDETHCHGNANTLQECLR